MADDPETTLALGMRVFGAAPAGVVCQPRRAAYAVIAGADGRVAAVQARLKDGASRYWLPGGGMEQGESPAETVVREVREELARDVCVGEEIGKATQYFYAGDDGRWYEMRAIFVRAAFRETMPGRSSAGGGEFKLHWVGARADAGMFFHECHIWAVGHGE